jgi:hypothetical protein
MAVEMGVIGSPVMGWGVEIAAGDVEMLHGGATVDWTTVAALGADVTLPDGTVARTGEQWLFPGQVLMEITSGGSIRMMGPYRHRSHGRSPDDRRGGQVRVGAEGGSLPSRPRPAVLRLSDRSDRGRSGEAGSGAGDDRDALAGQRTDVG